MGATATAILYYLSPALGFLGGGAMGYLLSGQDDRRIGGIMGGVMGSALGLFLMLAG